MVEVHPTAIVHRKAELGEGIRIGPFTFIGEHVRIGSGTEVSLNVVITGWTRIGANCKIHMGAIIGHESQVKGLKEMRSYLEIGDNNIIREYVTIHRSMKEEGVTSIGNDNFIMTNVHIAHDCRLGNGIVITNASLLAGHVEIEDLAFISGLVGIHQFVRVGQLAMIGGLCKLTQDAPPYMLVEGYPGRVCGLNTVGLKRAGLSSQTMSALKQVYRILFRSDLNMSRALKKVEEEFSGIPEVAHLVNFIRNSDRGVCQAKSTISK